MICYDKKTCKTCKVTKNHNSVDFYLHNKVRQWLTNDCKVCLQVKSTKRDQTPEGRARAKAKRERLKPYYQAYHKTPKAKAAMKEIRKRPEHRRLRIFLEAKRYAAKKERTPSWADMDAIRQVYLNCPDGYEVDHIIPLQGDIVSGFHVAENLQYLTPRENQSKNNKFEGIVIHHE